MADTFLLTTGNNFEGYSIQKYLGICSGEYIAKMGFLDPAINVMNYVFSAGSEQDVFDNKLQQLKETAIRRMKDDARKLKANAILGVDIKYTLLTKEDLAISVNGTAVYIEPILKIEPKVVQEQYTVRDYGPSMPIYPQNVNLISVDGQTQFELSFLVQDATVSTISADICFANSLGEKIACVDATFTEIEYQNFLNGSLGKTEMVSADISINQIKMISQVYVYVRRAMCGDVLIENNMPNQNYQLTSDELLQLQRVYGVGAVCQAEQTESGWRCVCGREASLEEEQCPHCGRLKRDCFTKIGLDTRRSQLLEQMEEAKNARAIYDMIGELVRSGQIALSDSLMKKISDLVNSERIYGNMKNSVMQVLREELTLE